MVISLFSYGILFGKLLNRIKGQCHELPMGDIVNIWKVQAEFFKFEFGKLELG